MALITQQWQIQTLTMAELAKTFKALNKWSITLCEKGQRQCQPSNYRRTWWWTSPRMVLWADTDIVNQSLAQGGITLRLALMAKWVSLIHYKGLKALKGLMILCGILMNFLQLVCICAKIWAIFVPILRHWCGISLDFIHFVHFACRNCGKSFPTCAVLFLFVQNFAWKTRIGGQVVPKTFVFRQFADILSAFCGNQLISCGFVRCLCSSLVLFRGTWG